MESNRSDKAVEGRGLAGQHSIPLSVALHLVPGLLIVLAYYFLGVPAARAAGYPSLFGFFLAAAAVLVPWELGVILYAGKQDTGSLTFRPLTFRERLPRLRLFITVFLLFSWALAVVVLLGWLDTVILIQVLAEDDTATVEYTLSIEDGS